VIRASHATHPSYFKLTTKSQLLRQHDTDIRTDIRITGIELELQKSIHHALMVDTF
jgi:hypothetical protein